LYRDRHDEQRGYNVGLCFIAFCRDLDENLKKTFYKFLEIRGVKASTTNFLHEYMTRKVNREYFLWLKNVKEFMEQ